MFESRSKLMSGRYRYRGEPAHGGSVGLRRTGLAAFTLLELLVVVFIVGVLAALLSTAFNNTRARGHRISCINNLRQMQYAWRLYIDENLDMLPLNKSVDGALPERFFGRPNSPDSWVVGTPKADITPENLIAGTMFPYTERSASVYRCPADRSTVFQRPDVLRNRSYSMSAYLAGDAQGIDPRVKARDSELNNPSPASVFVYIEEHEDSPWLGSFMIASQEKIARTDGTWISMPSDRHNQGCNLGFADLHVEYWKWYWPKRVDVQTTKLTANGHELRDLWRLQGAVPKP